MRVPPFLLLFLTTPTTLASPAAAPVPAAAPQLAGPRASSPPLLLNHREGKRDGSSSSSSSNILRLPMRRRGPLIQAMTTTMVGDADMEGTKTKTPHHHTTTSIPSPVAVNVTGMFKDVAYGVKVWIGSPEQAVVLDFDTGSSETWVDPPCTGWEGLDEYEALCRELGTYVPQQSDTSIDINATCPPRWITYGSGAAAIRYYKDTVNFVDPWDYESMGASFKLHKPVQFGVATWSQNMVSGIMGAGYGRGYNQKYSGFIDEIFDQGLVLDKDFAIALGSVDEGEGELVFGGIDLSKFMGPLNGLPLADQYSGSEDGFFRYWINVTSIGVTPPGSCVTTPVTNSSWTERFLPDTGTTLTYLPEEAFYAILDHFPDARPEPGFGYSISCSHKNDQGTIDFGFDGFTIHVPYAEFIFEIPADFSNSGEDMCVLGAIPADSFYILGDTFLRAAYAVFRQQEHKVYLAQFINCGEDIVSSHGDISKLYGNCGHRRPYAPPSGDGDDTTVAAQPYGPPTSPSNATTSAKPSATPIGFGTCRSYSTGTYSTLGYATLSSFNERARHDMSVFPRPALQTNLKDRNGNNIDPRPTMSAVAAKSSSKKAVKIITRTSVMTFDAVTLPDTTLPATVLTTTYTISENAIRPQATKEPKETTTECTDEVAPATVSGNSFGSSTTELTFTMTGDGTTFTTVMTEAIDPGASVTTMRGLRNSESHSLTDSYSTDSYSYTDSHTTDSYSYTESYTTDSYSYTDSYSSTDSYSNTNSYSYTESSSYTDSAPPSSSFDWDSWFSSVSKMFSTVSDSVMTPVESFTPTDTSTYAESILTSVASPISTSADYTDTSYDSYYPPSSYSPHLSSVSYTDSYSYSYSDSGESSSTPTVVTIPVETDETIIVMRHSTTYTIVDGATVTSDFSAKGTGTGTGTGTGSISYTETGVWKNTTTSRKHTRTTRKATTTSESSITIDGYITGWSWTPVSDDPAMRTWEAVRRDEGDALGAEDDCEDYESENQVDLE